MPARGPATEAALGKVWGTASLPRPPALATHLLRVKQPMAAAQPQPPLLPAKVAQLPLKMLRKVGASAAPRQGPRPAQEHTTRLGASPAEQGKGELADGGDHQVNPHSLPGRVGSLGTPDSSPSGLQQAENADTLLKGIHGVVLPVEAAGVSPW